MRTFIIIIILFFCPLKACLLISRTINTKSVIHNGVRIMIRKMKDKRISDHNGQCILVSRSIILGMIESEESEKNADIIPHTIRLEM